MELLMLNAGSLASDVKKSKKIETKLVNSFFELMGILQSLKKEEQYVNIVMVHSVWLIMIKTVIVTAIKLSENNAEK